MVGKLLFWWPYVKNSYSVTVPRRNRYDSNRYTVCVFFDVPKKVRPNSTDLLSTFHFNSPSGRRVLPGLATGVLYLHSGINSLARPVHSFRQQRLRLRHLFRAGRNGQVATGTTTTRSRTPAADGGDTAWSNGTRFIFVQFRSGEGRMGARAWYGSVEPARIVYHKIV